MRILDTSERTLKRRLTRADAFTWQGRMSLAQIAIDLGFSEPATFSQAYEKRTGVVPSKAEPA